MPKTPDPRAVAAENRLFLRHLRSTGNAHEAARRTGHSRTRFTKRRARDPAFAQRWDAALALARARLSSDAPHTVMTRAGPQLRRPRARLLTPERAQAFLAALSATANVRLSAEAAGAGHASFYALKRRDPAFAREWRLALEQGYERVQLALMESALADSYEHDGWRSNDPPAVPPMTATQALQLLHLHQKAALMLDEPPHLKRRRGESRDAHSYRLGAMYEATMEREREKYRVAEAERAAGTWTPEAQRPPKLPDLAQVTGWSKAKLHAAWEASRETAPARPAGGDADPSDDAGFDPASGPMGGKGPVYHPERALFGGWRIDDMKKRGKKR